MKEQQQHGWVYYHNSPTFMGPKVSERMTGVVKAIENWWPAE